MKGVCTKIVNGTPYHQARIRIGGKNLHLGYFTTPEKAHRAYKIARAKYPGWERVEQDEIPKHI